MHDNAQFPGRGQVIVQATSTSNNQPADVSVETIAVNAYSQWMSFDNAKQIVLLLHFTSDPTAASFDIERKVGSGSQIHATVAVGSANLVYQWTSTGPLGGEFRIRNNSGIILISLRMQKYSF